MTAAAEIATIGGTGTLAVRADQTWWTDSQAEMLRAMGVDKDVTRGELLAFLHLCQKTGLDPATRQVYLIGRMDRRAGRKVYTPQTAIDGYRVIAHRVAAIQGEHFAYEDQQWCGDDGRWSDVWLSSSPPAAARVVVVREGNRFPGVALWAEYRQTNRDGALTGLWASMPAAQLAKCAEALALRKAFPNDLAGIYTAEEMGQADNPPVVATTVVQSAPARVTAAEILASHTSGGDVTPPVPGSAPDDVPSPPEPEPTPDVFHDADPEKLATRPQVTKIAILMEERGVTDRDDRLAWLSEIVGRPIASSKDLTRAEASEALDVIESTPAGPPDSEPDATLDGTA